MENWCFKPFAIQFQSHHLKADESLPRALGFWNSSLMCGESTMDFGASLEPWEEPDGKMFEQTNRPEVAHWRSRVFSVLSIFSPVTDLAFRIFAAVHSWIIQADIVLVQNSSLHLSPKTFSFIPARAISHTWAELLKCKSAPKNSHLLSKRDEAVYLWLLKLTPHRLGFHVETTLSESETSRCVTLQGSMAYPVSFATELYPRFQKLQNRLMWHLDWKGLKTKPGRQPLPDFFMPIPWMRRSDNWTTNFFQTRIQIATLGAGKRRLKRCFTWLHFAVSEKYFSRNISFVNTRGVQKNDNTLEGKTPQWGKKRCFQMIVR